LFSVESSIVVVIFPSSSVVFTSLFKGTAR
jgi:hypothetical protein